MTNGPVLTLRWRMRLTLIVIVIGVVAGSFAAGAIWRDATLPAGRGAVPLARASATPIAAADTGAANGAAASPPAPGETAGAPAPGATTPIPSASPSVGAQAPAPPTDPAAFVAPVLAGPLPQRDPTLRSVANASTAWLSQSSSAPSLLRAPAGALVTDWRLNDPSQRAVRGYAGGVSVIPGDRIDLHLAGTDRTARLDIFRMGLGDAHHVETIRDVPVFAETDASPGPSTGRIEDHWPISLWLSIGPGWRPGVYLAKATGSSGGQSYVLFLVRSPHPSALTVVLPFLTYQAYNHEGGANLYGWDGGPHARAYEVSFDRPYRGQYGAGQFFWLDFPLIVWLEDHGYDPAYVTDLDLARDPVLVEGIQTLVFAGHGEYWTGGLRDAVQTASGRGTNLAFFGANDAYWQVRLRPDRAGVPDRTIVCYKDASLDPVAAQDPGDATVEFSNAAVGRPFSSLTGAEYGGIVRAAVPLVVGPVVSTFAPEVGLQPGDPLAGLVGGEVDMPKEPFGGELLGTATVAVGPARAPVTTGPMLWINPAGGRAFDAGTLGWSWGLDPRYAASAVGFPAGAFDQLTARVLAWAGAQPDPQAAIRSPVLSAPPSRSPVPAPAAHVKVVAGVFTRPEPAIARAARLGRLGITGFAVEEEPQGRGSRYEVERAVSGPAAAAALLHRLRADAIHAGVEIDRGASR